MFFPTTPEEYSRQAETLLSAETIDVPPAFKHNARRFLYYQLYRTSLPFDAFLEEDGVWPGYVRIKDLEYTAFDPQNASAKGANILKTIMDGILNDQEYLLNE